MDYRGQSRISLLPRPPVAPYKKFDSDPIIGVDIQMAEVRREDVLKALARVIDADSGKPIAEAGLVQGLAVKNGHVSFAIEVPAARGAHAEPLRKRAEAEVSSLPGVLSVTAVLTAHQEAARGGAQPRRHAPPSPSGIA